MCRIISETLIRNQRNKQGFPPLSKPPDRSWFPLNHQAGPGRSLRPCASPRSKPWGEELPLNAPSQPIPTSGIDPPQISRTQRLSWRNYHAPRTEAVAIARKTEAGNTIPFGPGYDQLAGCARIFSYKGEAVEPSSGVDASWAVHGHGAVTDLVSK